MDFVRSHCIVQVSFCEEKSVQLFKVAFFQCDFLQNSYFGTVMPCPFTCPKMFWAGPNFFCQTKSLFTYCVKQTFCPTKRWFAFCKIVFCADTKVFEEALH